MLICPDIRAVERLALERIGVRVLTYYWYGLVLNTVVGIETGSAAVEKD